MAEDLSLLDRKAIHQLLESRHDEANFIGWVDCIETPIKGERIKEKRIVVVSKKRMYSLRGGGKVVNQAHYLDLSTMKSQSSTDVELVFKTFTWAITSTRVDELIHTIRSSFSTAFPGVPEKNLYKIEVKPDARLRELQLPAQSLGGFVSTYKSCCDYFGTDEVSGIVWELDNVAAKLNTKEFNLKEMEPLDAKDFKPLVTALGYNKHFRILQATGYKMSKDMQLALAEALKLNSSLEELHLAKADLVSAGVEKIAESLSFNKTLALTLIDMSGNKIEDKGFSALGSYIAGMTRGLVHVNLSSCGAGKSGTNALCSALKRNVHMSSTLTFFDVSNNELDNEGSAALATFLAAPNSLQHLLVRDTKANLDQLIAAIIRGSTNELRRIDFSENRKRLTRKEGSSLAKYVAAAATLHTLNLSATEIPPESVTEILRGLNSNLFLKKVSLDLSDNKLGAAGAKAVADLADKLNNLTSLNLADNQFGDDGIPLLVEGLKKNNTIKHLVLDRNFKGGKSDKKTRKVAVDSLISLIGATTAIESFSLQGDKESALKDAATEFLQALSANTSLISLDVSGNEIGDRGVNVLAKSLQTNDKLESLKWDNNGTSLKGFESFASGLRRNRTLKNMTLPTHDIAGAQKDGKDALDGVVSTIERLMSRNQSPTAKADLSEGTVQAAGPSGNVFAFFSSGLREEMTQYLNKIKSTGKKPTGRDQVTVEDAENSDNVMIRLFNFQDEIQAQMDKDLKEALESSVQVISPAFGKMKSQLIDKLMDVIQKSIKCLDEDTVRRLRTVMAYGGKDLSETDLGSLLVDSALIELGAKANQGFHSVITIASEYLYEKIGGQLRSTYDDLTADIQAQEEQAIEEAKLSTLPQATPPASPTPQPAGSTIKTKEEPKKDAQPAGSVIKPKEEPKGTTIKEKKDEEKPKGTTIKEKKDDGPVVNIESLAKKEGNLQHAVKDRPVQAGKRPPTRKK